MTIPYEHMSHDEFISAAQAHPARAEINRRVTQIMETAQFPEVLYTGFDPEKNAYTVYGNSTSDHRSLLFFSAPHTALDYLRTTKHNAQVGIVRVADLPAMAKGWRASGIDSFIMNRCPRCPTRTIVTPKDGLILAEEVKTIWAVSRAVRDWQGQARVRAYLEQKGPDMAQKQRAILEAMRDHLDYSVPYIHWLIALLAGVQGDEPARIASTTRMLEFGPGFSANDTLPGVPPDQAEWRDSLARATIGFLHSFDMLPLAVQPTVM